MKTPLLELRHFTKRFRSHWTFRPIEAVNNVSLSVYPGECFGFLGHNGAGKTTTIKTIAGLLRLSGGEILLDGKPLEQSEQRNILGYLPEQPYFYDHLSVEETLSFFASLYGLSGAERKERINETLELVHLTERKKSSVRALSKGLQQRLGLAQAILNKPRLLLLDEPFSGLDPLGRMEVRDLLLDLRRQGTTIFISSHILSDVENLCDRIAIMARGRLKALFHLSEAAELYGEAFELVVEGISPPREFSVDAVEQKVISSPLGDRLALRFSTYEAAERALAKATATGLRVFSFRAVSKSLEEIFVAITEEDRITLPTATVLSQPPKEE